MDREARLEAMESRVQGVSCKGHDECYFRLMRVKDRLKGFMRMGNKEIEAVVAGQFSKMLTSELTYRSRL